MHIATPSKLQLLLFFNFFKKMLDFVLNQILFHGNNLKPPINCIKITFKFAQVTTFET